MDNETLLQIHHLTIAYRRYEGEPIPVVRNVSLTMSRGEALGLVGESGCGKSTLGMALVGHLRPGSNVIQGTVFFKGTNVFALTQRQLQQLRRQHIGIVPQNTSQVLTPTMRIGNLMNEIHMLYGRLNKQEATQRTIDLFNQVRLPQPTALLRRYPHELSGGQQQRVAIALALAHHPEVLIFDEPTTGLDVTTQAHVLNLLQDIAQTTGTAMLYISHDLGVIARVSQRVAVMYAGELVEVAHVVPLFSHPKHPYTQGLLASVPRLSCDTLPDAMPGMIADIHGPGCSFAPRCASADEMCRTISPVFNVNDDEHSKNHEPERHMVRCHHWEDIAHHQKPSHGRIRLHRNGHPPTNEIILGMQDVSISYATHGVLQQLRRLPAPNATVNDITVHIYRGKTLALVGESGSGKTTIIRALAGLKRIHSGRITFRGTDVTLSFMTQRSPDMRRAIQLIFQNPDSSLNPRHTVEQILARPLRLYFKLDTQACSARSLELLNLVRLGPSYLHRFPNQLSGGEKQRVAIARAFAAEPEVVLCDEVVSALDVSVQAAVLDVLAELQREQHVSYLFITHDLALVRAFADHVAVLYQGRLCEIGPVSQIFAPPWHPYTRTLLDAVLEPIPHAAPHRRTNDIPEGKLPRRGCPFQWRCPVHQGTRCDEETPPWLSDTHGHAIRCHISLAELANEQENNRF